MSTRCIVQECLLRFVVLVIVLTSSSSIVRAQIPQLDELLVPPGKSLLDTRLYGVWTSKKTIESDGGEFTLFVGRSSSYLTRLELHESPDAANFVSTGPAVFELVGRDQEDSLIRNSCQFHTIQLGSFRYINIPVHAFDHSIDLDVNLEDKREKRLYKSLRNNFRFSSLVRYEIVDDTELRIWILGSSEYLIDRIERGEVEGKAEISKVQITNARDSFAVHLASKDAPLLFSKEPFFVFRRTSRASRKHHE